MTTDDIGIIYDYFSHKKLKEVTRWAEKIAIIATLKRLDGNRRHSAISLGINIRTFRKKIIAYKIKMPSLFTNKGRKKKDKKVLRRKAPANA